MESGIVTDAFLRTSVDNVFACGDCAQIAYTDGDTNHSGALNPGQFLQELNWYGAKRQGAHVAQNILGAPRPYSPPVFFNSSKFFELEFTQVGLPPLGLADIEMTHFHCAKRKALLRIVHERTPPQRVLAFHVIGARVDHSILTEWVENGRSLGDVLQDFQTAQFDVEFGRVPFEMAKRLADHDEQSAQWGGR